MIQPLSRSNGNAECRTEWIERERERERGIAASNPAVAAEIRSSEMINAIRAGFVRSVGGPPGQTAVANGPRFALLVIRSRAPAATTRHCRLRSRVTCSSEMKRC